MTGHGMIYRGQIIMSLSMAAVMETLLHTNPAFTMKSEFMSFLQFSSTYFKAVSPSACHQLLKRPHTF